MQSIIQRRNTFLHDDGSFTFDLRRKPSVFETREAAEAKAAELGLTDGSYTILTAASLPSNFAAPSLKDPVRP